MLPEKRLLDDTNSIEVDIDLDNINENTFATHIHFVPIEDFDRYTPKQVFDLGLIEKEKVNKIYRKILAYCGIRADLLTDAYSKAWRSFSKRLQSKRSKTKKNKKLDIKDAYGAFLKAYAQLKNTLLNIVDTYPKKKNTRTKKLRLTISNNNNDSYSNINTTANQPHEFAIRRHELILQPNELAIQPIPMQTVDVMSFLKLLTDDFEIILSQFVENNSDTFFSAIINQNINSLGNYLENHDYSAEEIAQGIKLAGNLAFNSGEKLLSIYYFLFLLPELNLTPQEIILSVLNASKENSLSLQVKLSMFDSTELMINHLMNQIMQNQCASLLELQEKVFSANTNYMQPLQSCVQLIKKFIEKTLSTSLQNTDQITHTISNAKTSV